MCAAAGRWRIRRDGADVAKRAACMLCAALALAPALSAPADARWRPAAHMDAGRRAPTATLLYDGKVLVAGGAGAKGALASAELYDPLRDAWSAAGAMTTPRRGHSATLLRDGAVLVVGGTDGRRALASAELYRPASNRWSAVPRMAAAREQHTATLLADGSVLVVGGFDGARALASAERYDPARRAWSPAGRLAVARGAHTATGLADGSVFVAGGFTATGATAETERYDPARRLWARTAPMIGARESHTATLQDDGRIAMVGGNAADGPIADVELVDPGSDARWTASSMATVRYAHAATLLPTGRVLVTGGFAEDGVTADAEVYDPATDAWSAAPSMATAREQHAATLLASGDVLVAGGFTGSASASRAELYVPKRATAITVRAPSPIVVGTTVAATATVGGLPGRGGEVTFQAFKPTDATCSNVPSFIVTTRVGPDGTAVSRPLRPGTPGTWRWVARYSGDDASNDAESACRDPAAQLVVRKATPTIATRASASSGLGVLTAGAIVGGRVDPEPGATIAFQLYGPDDPTCSGSPAFASVVRYPPAGGAASSAPFAPSVPGTYRWRATYSGDASNAPVASACGPPTITSWWLGPLGSG